MNFNRILFCLILLLAITIVAEVAYLFVFQRAVNVATVAPQETNYFPSPQPEQALDEGSLQNLRKLKTGVITSSILTYTMDGTIREIEYLTEDNKRAIQFTIEGSNGNSNGFIYPDVSYMVTLNSNGEKIDLFDVSQNDQVRITVKFDILDSEYKSIEMEIL